MEKASTTEHAGWQSFGPDCVEVGAETLVVRFPEGLAKGRALVDPVGDLLSFYEFRVVAGVLKTAVWRVSRSGWRIDGRWESSARLEGAVLVIPFEDIGPLPWRVAVQGTRDGSGRALVEAGEFFGVGP
jgi:hypothetical protein